MSCKVVTTASEFLFKLQRCRQMKDIELARCLHSGICEHVLEKNEDVCSYLVSTYVDCRSMSDALAVFDKVVVPNEFAWTSLIQGWTQCGNPENSLSTYKRMQEALVHPSTHSFVALLKACSQLKWVDNGQVIHMSIVQIGYEGDSFIRNSMIDMYAKLGFIQDAFRIFNQTANRNVVTWNTLIAGYVEHGHNEDALSCLEVMESRGIPPDHATLSCIIKACNMLGDIDKGQEVHTKIMIRGFEKTESISTTLIDMYAKCGCIVEAQSVFDQVSEQTAAQWTALITGYLELGLGEIALKYIEQMQLQGVPPDHTNFLCSLKASHSMASVRKGQELHSEIVTKGMERNSFVSNALVDLYMAYDCLVEARHTFDQLQCHTISSWNVLISGYIQHRNNREALACVNLMRSTEMFPDVTTFSYSLKACGNLCAIEQGLEGHMRICKEGLENSIVVANTLIYMYARFGSLKEAQKVFDQLSMPNIVSWNTILTGYVECELGAEALKCLDEMRAKGIHSDMATYIGSLKACADLTFGEKGLDLHSDIIKEGLDTEPFVSNSLIDVYVKCGYFAEAWQLFELLPVRNVVSWSTMIAGFTECGCSEHALDCLKLMQAEGVSPNVITYLCSLKACGSIGAIDQGRELHADIIHSLFEKGMLDCITSEDSIVGDLPGADDVPLLNALIDMYCKCGSVSDAEKLFDTLPILDMVSWNVLMAGYARQGESISVFKVFERIKEQDAQPSDLIVLSVLSACSHAGLVEVGQNYFEAMDTKHSVAPTIAHYNCMLDLLGRAGLFNEASLLLKKMPLVANNDTWCTLLGACSKWGNVELGRLAFESAVKLDSSNAAAFIIMSNMYEETGMWDELRNMEAILEVSGKQWHHAKQELLEANTIGTGL